MRALSFALVLLATTVHAQTCPSGQALCGQSHCTPDGGVCCASVGHEELSCPSGSTCTGDGGCASSSSSCDPGWMITQASCGGDPCSCSAPCTTAADCQSGCCTTAGFCAPSCVCTGNGRLFVSCDISSGGATGLATAHGGGCAVGGGEGGSIVTVALALVALVLVARRRSAS